VSAWSLSHDGETVESCEIDGSNYTTDISASPSNLVTARRASAGPVLAGYRAVVIIPKKPPLAGSRYTLTVTSNEKETTATSTLPPGETSGLQDHCWERDVTTFAVTPPLGRASSDRQALVGGAGTPSDQGYWIVARTRDLLVR